MKKTYPTIVIISILILPVILSSLQVNYAATTQSTSKATVCNPLTTNNSQKVGVHEHKISSSELKQLKSEIGTFDGGKNYNQLIGDHGTGLQPPSNTDWESIAQNSRIIDDVSYPSTPMAIDNSQSPFFPPIGNQGSQGSCTTWAVGYYTKTHQEAKEHGWVVSGGSQTSIMSPSFIYNLINNGEDDGSSIESAIQLLQGIGDCSLATMPYNDADYTTWPTAQAWIEAANYRGNEDSSNIIYVQTDNQLLDLKNWLASGNLAVITVDATQIQDQTWGWSLLTDKDMLTLDNYNIPTRNHAVTVVGYDDNFQYNEQGQTHYGAFKIANSWGVASLPSPFSWERILDGFFWISYRAMEQQVRYCNVFTDKISYSPALLTTFRINHNLRSDCTVTIGSGTPEAPFKTKCFNDYISGGQHPFCTNNIVMDITELKENMTSLYNQPFFVSIYDNGPFSGSSATGAVTFFQIGSVSSTQTPAATINYNTIQLTLNYSLQAPTIKLSPASGPPSSPITLTGAGFTPGKAVNITYQNPLNYSWTTLRSDYTTVDGNFTLDTTTIDLLQNNQQGDNAESLDGLLFQVQGSSNGYSYNASAIYSEYRRGITQIGNSIAQGLFGNGTNLASNVFVQSGDVLPVAGSWFSPGTGTLLWDSLIIGTAIIDEKGTFNARLTVPDTTTGKHTLTIKDGATDFCVHITRVPFTTNDYVDTWHTSDLAVNLAPDSPINETFYRINGGSIQNVTGNGQPIITSEGAANTLEYWSKWNTTAAATIELPHVTITGIKLDKTQPSGIITTNPITASTSITLTLSANDSTSRVAQMRFSNDDNSWSNWELYTTSKAWTVPTGDGVKTVYVQFSDNAGLTSTYSCAVTLQTPQPMSTRQAANVPSATPATIQTAAPTAQPFTVTEPSPTPAVPELSFLMVSVLMSLSTLLAVVILKKRK